MFELTGELDYMVPHMISIFTSKWVGDYLQPHSLYSLSQTLLGHPFYDYNNYNPKTLFTHTLHDVQPPSHTMKQITLPVSNGRTTLSVLRDRLAFLLTSTGAEGCGINGGAAGGAVEGGILRRRSWSMRWDCWWGSRGRRNVFGGGGVGGRGGRGRRI